MNKRVSIATGLLAFLIITAVFTASVKANSWPNLPTSSVTLVVVDGIDSYFVSTLSNVPPGYDVSNGVYAGWCVDRRYHIPRGSNIEVILNSSLSPPVDLQTESWDMVNYIINHKQGHPMMDVQWAIWYFVNLAPYLVNDPMDPNNGYGMTFPGAVPLINDAIANGDGYVPGEGELLAIICYPDTPTQISIIELLRPPEEKYPKQFTGSYGFGGFTAPEIIDDGLNTTVVGLHSGPRVSWNVTYYFANTEEFLGSEFDGEAHYFRMWDKWGGNLMALDSTPIAFDPVSNIVTLADGTTFEINYVGYSAYIGTGLSFTDSNGNSAMITLHTGDQQQGTNPGKGKGTTKDGSSYDADLVWDIGYLEPGQSASLTIVIAPGKNPAGKLQFSSPGFQLINTGPRTRVYGDAGFTDFLYAIDQTIQLGVIVTK